ncbi:hypothetical protein ACLEJW_20075 [Pseudomonas sp. SMSB3]|uniref:hypothetical protein n=1 Tax=Pseudomonas sp. SMSB3 TaxID=3390196 RepID=UPI003F82A8B4
MNVITGQNEARIDSLVRSRASFEIIGLGANFMPGIKLVETKIEKLGMKCRVKSDVKARWCKAKHWAPHTASCLHQQR